MKETQYYAVHMSRMYTDNIPVKVFCILPHEGIYKTSKFYLDICLKQMKYNTDGKVFWFFIKIALTRTTNAFYTNKLGLYYNYCYKKIK